MEIKLPCGRVTLIDDADADLAAGHSWYSNRGGSTHYVYSDKMKNGVRTRTRLHRIIMSAPPNLEVDHVNGDALDNRRVNLRLATRAQNAANRSYPSKGYRGVFFRKKTGKYSAVLKHAFKQMWLGEFETPLEAALAFDDAALKLRGEFARLNFPAVS